MSIITKETTVLRYFFCKQNLYEIPTLPYHSHVYSYVYKKSAFRHFWFW